MRARIAVALLLLVATMALWSPTAASSQGAVRELAQAVVPATGSEIAFATNRNGSFDIYIMDGDGSNQTQITTDPANDTQPAWSPDAARIAFVRHSDIWVMNADGSGETALNTIDVGAEFDTSSHPTWSPDGTRIAYEHNGDIWTVNPDGSDPVRIVDLDVNEDPAWSPTGDQIAFVRLIGTGSDVFVKNLADTTGQGTNITNSASTATNAEPTWTRNGTHIVFTRQTLPPSVERPARTDRSRARSLARLAAWQSHRSMSVRPSVAAPEPVAGCIQSSTAVRDICMVDASGGGAVNLTSELNGELNADPAVAPDGSTMALERRVCVVPVVPVPVVPVPVVPDVERPDRISLWMAAAPVDPSCGSGFAPSYTISTMNIDGTAQVDLTTPSSVPRDVDPAWKPGAADLALSKSDDTDPVPIGGDFTYALAVTNNSASPATGVLVTDTLPPGVTFRGATPAGTCSGTPTITCSLGVLPEGTTVTISLFVTAPKTTRIIQNTASVAAASPADPDVSNNTDVEETRVVAADVSITKTDDPDPVLVGGELTYTMMVKNNGALTATDVVVTDPVPDGTKLLSASSTVGTCSGTSTVTCPIGTLQSGDSATVTAVVSVHGRERVVTNTAMVTATSPDDLVENNTASARTHVGVATLELVPPVGPPGFVTIAVGSGFPRHTEVTLAWDPGIGEVEVTTDADGAFRSQVLIFPGDIQGPRLLVATGGSFADVSAPFLVEPATIQPRDFASRS